MRSPFWFFWTEKNRNNRRKQICGYLASYFCANTFCGRSYHGQNQLTALSQLLCPVVYLFHGNPFPYESCKHPLTVACQNALSLQRGIHVQKHVQMIKIPQCAMTAVRALHDHDVSTRQTDLLPQRLYRAIVRPVNYRLIF
jgi:hypothetical protein